ncbi:MAG: transposase [Planctomycetota bacterium]
MIIIKVNQQDVPVDQKLDPEVLSFRAQVDQKSPFDERETSAKPCGPSLATAQRGLSANVVCPLQERWCSASEQSLGELLVDLKHRGLQMAPKIADGDGALGLWAAIRKAFTETHEQRCCVHQTVNVYNKMPKSVQSKAKDDLHEIWPEEAKADAATAFDALVEEYGAKYALRVNV